MLASLQNQLLLSTGVLAVAILVVFLASLIRGFAGFGLSSISIAVLTLQIPPVTLIPMFILLETLASMMLARGNYTRANLRISWGLALFSAIGLPLGLIATRSLPEDQSKMLALLLILFLALLQLFNRAPQFFSTKTGLYLAGLTAGIATGLASAGGMVVALFVLAQQLPAVQMRASIVVYLFLTAFASILTLVLTGMLDAMIFKRALFLAPFVIVGVSLGRRWFKPALEHWYKRFCLWLLIALASLGLARLLLNF
ncbi:MAG: sulfite exporter TauE/SafE family protein [Granulosicoccus sp.]|nr:sulfite exporter TauE/SafE family protein [Granulosicoccus sp.]